MRGKVSAISWAYKSGGITPAYAGKSFRSVAQKRSYLGSPPPMRGKGGDSGRQV